MRFIQYSFVIILLLLPKLIFGQAPDLGVSSSFALFTAAGAFNGDPGSSVVGDIGTNVGAFTPPGFLVGNIHLADPVSAQAAADVAVAYGFLDGLTCGLVLATPFGNNQTLTPNIYCIGSAAVLNATLTLDGGGNPASIFIFQIDGALSTNPGSNIIVTNGASLCNVYWQINGAFNHNGTTFQGTVIAAGALNFGTGARLTGRGLSTMGAINLSANNVTLPNGCLCELDVTCPDPAGGTFPCVNNIPVGTAADVTVNSACGTPTVAISNASTGSGCIASPYVLTRTYTVTDQGGHSAICVVTYTAIDQIAPTITCPAALAVSCANNVPAAAPASVVTADNCGGVVTVVSLGDAISNQTCANRYTITRTYRASDFCGSTATCSQTITVNDITAPSISCPANIVVSCAGNVPAAAPASVIASDLCGGTATVVLVGDVTTPGTCANRFTVARTYSATDLCGNTATCAQTITVNDITAPSISCPANIVVSCAGNVPAAAPASVIASDLCGGGVTVVLVGDVTTPGACANRFTVTRTYSATDLCGNTATCAQTITVNDITAPSISCPANTVVSCATEVPAAEPASVIASDLCGGAVTVVLAGDVTTPGACANRFTVTRTYRATDLCGNSATCAQIITVNDITAPTFNNPPANVTVECIFIPAVPANPTASDNCTGAVTVTFLGELQTPGICPTLYTLTRTWRATDACGNSVTASQVVTVIDTYAPQFIDIPANVVLECDQVTNLDDYQDWLDTHGGATVFDCSTIIWTYENSPVNLDTVGCAATFRRFIRFTATDECGNSTFRDARFTVIDLTPPTFTIPPQDLNVDCWMGEKGEVQMMDWLEKFGFAEVTDACGSVQTSVVFLSETQECEGTFKRTYQFRATDECGNTNFVTATFAIIDTVPPVIITCPPSNVLLTCEFDIPAANPAGVKAMDMCSAVTISVIDSFSVGVGCDYWQLTKSYVYAATDACGNVSTCYQSFQVVDSIPPIYSGPDTVFVQCVSDLPGPGDIEDVLAPYFVDNCYTIICVNESVIQNAPNSVTYCVNFKDLCVNWAPKIKVTFVANGGCKPICSIPQTTWGNPSGQINIKPTTEAIQQLISKYGAVKAGKLGKSISVSSVECLQNMLPGYGTTAQFNPGKHTFSSANECNSASPLLNSDGTLKNILAANVLALQLNIWYNSTFNERNLGVQAMSSLPLDMVNPIVIGKLEVDHSNIQGLLNLSNDYLAGVGFFPQNFGIPLNNALENVNSYWQNCQPNTPNPTSASVAGHLKTEAQEGLKLATIQLEGASNTGPIPNTLGQSDEAGFYEFSNAVPISGNYTVTPSSQDMAFLNGVTTYDLVLISKHILGWIPFNSPYKMIAADANRSGSITTLDQIELRKLILGIYDELPNNTSWRFIDQSFVFPNQLNPFSTPFPEHKTLADIQGNQMAEDFVCVKIGDVNGSAQANSQSSGEERSTGTLLFDANDRNVKSGEIFELKMKADQIVQGYQFTLNTTSLEVLEVSGKQMNMGNFAVFNSNATLTTSWNMPEGNTPEVAEFTLKFRATQSGQLSEMLGISSRVTKAEAYRPQNNDANTPLILDIALRFHDKDGSMINGNGFELYQNIPNPFVDGTTIGFNLPEATQAILTIYDQTGRLVYTQKGDFDKGYNTFTIEGQLIKTTGTLLYKLETATDLAIRKMIQTR